MLMICSSRARNRSADPVVSCFFGRIAPSDASQNHDLQDEQIQKKICKLLRPQVPESCNLKTEAAPKSDSCSTTYELFTANYQVGLFKCETWQVRGLPTYGEKVPR